MTIWPIRRMAPLPEHAGARTDLHSSLGPARGATEAAHALELHDLQLAHDDHIAVESLSGRFAPGRLTAVVGPNGAGKSTLLAALAGLLTPRQGRIDRGTAPRIAYLPQATAIDRSFPVTVGELVAMGLWHRIGLFRGIGPAQRQAIDAAFAAVGLQGLSQRLVGELSAGQMQRALFARLLLQDAPLILLDEPFNAVDARTTADLLALLQRWRAEGRTVIAVLHDLAQVRAHFDETLLLARRAVAWGPTADVLTDDHLRLAQRMADGWDDADAVSAATVTHLIRAA